MFVDYIALMLVNMAAGLFILAAYVYFGLDDPDQKRWVPAFAMPGLVALVSGLHMIFVWPLPGPFNSAFGETSVLLGVLFTGAALALAAGWNLLPTAVYAFFAGLAAIVIGVRVIGLNLTLRPDVTGMGFILSGLGGVFAAPMLFLRENRPLRIAGAVVLAMAAAIWAFTGYASLWGHMQSFAGWQPR